MPAAGSAIPGHKLLLLFVHDSRQSSTHKRNGQTEDGFLLPPTIRTPLLEEGIPRVLNYVQPLLPWPFLLCATACVYVKGLLQTNHGTQTTFDESFYSHSIVPSNKVPSIR